MIFIKKNQGKPDDRRDNVDKLQFAIDHTISNYRESKDIIALTEDEKLKSELEKKNQRRENAIDSMRDEIRDEAIAKENDYR